MGDKGERGLAVSLDGDDCHDAKRSHLGLMSHLKLQLRHVSCGCVVDFCYILEGQLCHRFLEGHLCHRFVCIDPKKRSIVKHPIRLCYVCCGCVW